MTRNDSPHIAVIGLGAMGLPMAIHLATTFVVTGFEPFPPRRGQAEMAGITAESTPAAACTEADIALLAVRDQAQAETALFGFLIAEAAGLGARDDSSIVTVLSPDREPRQPDVLGSSDSSTDPTRMPA
jgi:3-hydroxyisobutyrate dehydrogenase-like beta-hydroxyacid dehydrogenase